MTPLWRAVEEYLAKDASRFHMPGHKGAPLPLLGDVAKLDLTEVPGLDSLYQAQGAILETEQRYARLYRSAGSFLSAGGSTLCIQSMLALAAPPGSKILAARGIHTAAVNAMALLDLRPVWLYPEVDRATGLALELTPELLEAGLKAHPDASCVYVTSPTYYGVMSDIGALSAVCRRFGVPLLVDNAHGAHLPFLPSSLHPMDLGADICCDSLHKTLPVLTGGAVLHIKNPRFLEQAKSRMALFGSTSPSYLILLSLDLALEYLEHEAEKDLGEVCRKTASLRALAEKRGFAIPHASLEPTRLVFGFASMGYTGSAFAQVLAQHHLEPEYLGETLCILLMSGKNTEQDFQQVEDLLQHTPSLPPLPTHIRPLPRPRQVLSLRDATFAQAHAVPLEDGEGLVAGSAVTPCPPGIPLVLPGERIDRDCAGQLESYGISTVNVVQY